jgi:hypothetical protein
MPFEATPSAANPRALTRRSCRCHQTLSHRRRSTTMSSCLCRCLSKTSRRCALVSGRRRLPRTPWVSSLCHTTHVGEDYAKETPLELPHCSLWRSHPWRHREPVHRRRPRASPGRPSENRWSRLHLRCPFIYIKSQPSVAFSTAKIKTKLTPSVNLSSALDLETDGQCLMRFINLWTAGT